ncbi:MAG: hypothetical protein QGG01_12325, partial [Roseibacillus sp.]|nr:hypothetical protein [Roseibacillus sp.]
MPLVDVHRDEDTIDTTITRRKRLGIDIPRLPVGNARAAPHTAAVAGDPCGDVLSDSVFSESGAADEAFNAGDELRQLHDRRDNPAASSTVDHLKGCSVVRPAAGTS